MAGHTIARYSVTFDQPDPLICAARIAPIESLKLDAQRQMNSPNNDNASPEPERSGDQREQRQIYEYRNGSSLWSWIKGNANTIFNGLLVLFTFVLAASTIGLWWETRELGKSAESQAMDLKASISVAERSAKAAENSAKIAENALVASERPWITVDVIGVGGPLTYRENAGADITLKFVLENIGRSPATYVNVDAEVWMRSDLGVEVGSTQDIQREIIKMLEKRGQIPIGYTLFPNQKMAYNFTLTISKEKIIEKKTYVDQYKRESQTGPFLPIVVGVVTYRSVFNQDIHHTAFAVDVLRRTSDGTRGISMDGVDIPADELAVQKSFDTGDYAD